MPRDFVTPLQDDIEAAVRQSFDDARLEAQRLSSGPYSQSQLDDMDNPYARRHGEPLLDPSVINAQTGAFRSHWLEPTVSTDAGDISAELVNDSDVADFLRLGTRYMVPRPIGDEVESYANERLQLRIDRAVSDWERRTY